ncbi:MAG: DUF5777 family beta-barrel protein [Bacteroidota bacterium]
MKKTVSIVTLILSSLIAFGQEDLLSILESEAEPESSLIYATFKGTRLINGHSVETRGKHELELLISHRFGEIDEGIYDLFGLDQANMRLGFNYGFTDRLTIGFGRSSFEKTYDGYVKYRLLQQTTGSKTVPLSITLFASSTVKTLRSDFYEDFNSRLAYTSQLLIARKFSPALSLQLMPTYIHFNLATPSQSDQYIVALGMGGRIKLSNRVSLNLEYYPRLNATEDELYDALAVGFDIETGGHVFQLHFTNSRAMIEKGFIAETDDEFFAAEIRLGFNLSRTFMLKKSDQLKTW